MNIDAVMGAVLSIFNDLVSESNQDDEHGIMGSKYGVNPETHTITISLWSEKYQTSVTKPYDMRTLSEIFSSKDMLIDSLSTLAYDMMNILHLHKNKDVILERS